VKSGRINWGGNVAWTWERRNSHKLLVKMESSHLEYQEGGRRWDNVIKMDIKGVRCEDERWREAAQNHV